MYIRTVSRIALTRFMAKIEFRIARAVTLARAICEPLSRDLKKMKTIGAVKIAIKAYSPTSEFHLPEAQYGVKTRAPYPNATIIAWIATQNVTSSGR